MKDKMTSKVIESENYSQFKVSKENRGVDPTHVRKLAISMKKHGWWDGFPMVVCTAPGGGFIIRDGQNRFRAAQSIKIPVKFIVDEASANIPLAEINDGRRNWKMMDYIISHAHSGDQDFQAALDFIRETGAPVSAACSLLAKTGISMRSLKSGNFAVVDVEWAKERFAELKSMKAHLDFAPLAIIFTRCYIKAAQVDGFNPDTFIHRVKNYPHLLPTPANDEICMESIERCYNHRNSAPLPIKFMASSTVKAARSRAANSPASKKARRKAA